jgi:DNA processing protein
LLKTNRAALVETPEDIAYYLGWEDIKPEQTKQPELFVSLTDDEQVLYDILRESGECGIDEIMVKSKLQVSKIASSLLNMEFQGIVMSLPGKRYKLK